MIRNVYNIVDNKLEGKRSFERPRCKEKAKRQWGKIGWGDDQINMAKDRDLWRTVVERNGNCGSILGKAFIDTISNQWRFKHSVLFCRFR